jgi:glycosyltransferase involved in cell wall biosynthesis
MKRFTQSGAEVFVYERRPQAWNSEIKTTSQYFVYDCMDDWEGFTGSDARTSGWEAELCERADQIWVVSRHLERKLAHWAEKVRYVPNGVDFQHFALARDIREASGGSGSRPKAIYIGTLCDWFDSRLVSEVAKRLRDWQIELIGPQHLSAQQRRWLDQPNIHLLGRCDYQDLPSLLAQADVALIPFVINDLIRGTSPIKLYEYLAAGIPVVATPMPEVLPYIKQGVVACADSPNEFARFIEESAHSANPDRCQEVGRASSWDARFCLLLQGLEAELGAPVVQ